MGFRFSGSFERLRSTTHAAAATSTAAAAHATATITESSVWLKLLPDDNAFRVAAGGTSSRGCTVMLDDASALAFTKLPARTSLAEPQPEVQFNGMLELDMDAIDSFAAITVLLLTVLVELAFPCAAALTDASASRVSECVPDKLRTDAVNESDAMMLADVVAGAPLTDWTGDELITAGAFETENEAPQGAVSLDVLPLAVLLDAADA